ncbi:MAG: insulinase family protein, partial [Eubacterium sp.]|nr:insulinase family protein [Eubacterium sp.]
MNIAEKTKQFGFTINRIRKNDEINGTLYEMSHDKTGAELCWLDNGEQNKLFSVAFKTLPEDSTGVFHILEHSVLCGSEKYPVKEPFVELMKSSMNTFLNAMTYPDKTVYPISSRNDKDFLNLTSVYLDAAFAPKILENPNIFYQEGIHIEFNEENPAYKGVVFNEMKGAMSGVDDRIEQGINNLLFPDNCYRFNSGGDPAVIPDLTYEQFVETYRRFYHPSNARFFLDGDIPLEKTLAMIHSYLEKYEKSNKLPVLSMQKPVSNEGTAYYEITDCPNSEKKAVLALGKIIGAFDEKEKVFAAKVLCDVLADSNDSPLKRAVLSSGIAEDMEMMVIDGVAQPYLLIIVRNMKDSDSSEICNIIKETVKQLVADGLDKKSVLASINRFAFHLRQVPEPQGLYRATFALNGWLYGGDPMLYLDNDEVTDTLKKMAETNAFETLMEELLLDDRGKAVLHMLPSSVLGNEERKAEENRIKSEISALTEEEKQLLVHQNEQLALWQQTPDSAEAVEALPMLSLNEVSDTPELIKTVETCENGVNVLYHPINTNGIVYLSMYFPLTVFSLSELTQLSLFPSLFGEFPTENYSVTELQQNIKTYIGSLSFAIEAFGKDNQTEKCTPFLTVRAGILEENLSTAKALINEVLTKSKFDDVNKIKEIVMQTYEMARQSAIGNGHSLGVGAVQAQYSAKGAVNEAINGYSSMKFLHDFADDFNGMVNAFISLVNRVKAEAVCKANLTVSITSSENVSVSDLLSKLPSGNKMPKEAEYKTDLPKRMGIRIPAQIAFAVKGYHLLDADTKMNGSLRIASNIISLNYLWNIVRVQGGAYGAGFPGGRDGGMNCYSYRDPSPARSLQVYNSLSDFICD